MELKARSFLLIWAVLSIVVVSYGSVESDDKDKSKIHKQHRRLKENGKSSTEEMFVSRPSGASGSRLHRAFASALRSEPYCSHMVQNYPFHIPIGDGSIKDNNKYVSRLLDEAPPIIWAVQGGSGLGNGLYGFVLAFVQSLLTGRALVVAGTPGQTLPSDYLCEAMECMYPRVNQPLLERNPGVMVSHGYMASSISNIDPCLLRVAGCEGLNSAHCFTSVALRTLLSGRMNARYVDKLGPLFDHFVGDRDRLVSLLRSPFTDQNRMKFSLHIRTLNPASEAADIVDSGSLQDSLKSSISAHQRHLYEALLQTGICTFDKPQQVVEYCYRTGVCDESGEIKVLGRRQLKSLLLKPIDQKEVLNHSKKANENISNHSLHVVANTDSMSGKMNSEMKMNSRKSWLKRNDQNYTENKLEMEDKETVLKKSHNGLRKPKRRLSGLFSQSAHVPQHPAHPSQEKEQLSNKKEHRTIFIASDSLEVKQGLHMLHHNPKQGVSLEWFNISTAHIAAISRSEESTQKENTGVFELSKLMTFAEFFCLTRSLEVIAVRLTFNQNKFQAMGALSTYVETASQFGNSQLDKCKDLKKWGSVAVLPQPRFITPPPLLDPPSLANDFHVNNEDISEDEVHHIQAEGDELYEHYIMTANKHFPNVVIILHEPNNEQMNVKSDESYRVGKTLSLVATAIHLFGQESLIMVFDLGLKEDISLNKIDNNFSESFKQSKLALGLFDVAKSQKVPILLKALPMWHEQSDNMKQTSCGSYRPLLLLTAATTVSARDGDQLIYFDSSLSDRLTGATSDTTGSSDAAFSLKHAMKELVSKTKKQSLDALEVGLSIGTRGKSLTPQVSQLNHILDHFGSGENSSLSIFGLKHKSLEPNTVSLHNHAASKHHHHPVAASFSSKYEELVLSQLPFGRLSDARRRKIQWQRMKGYETEESRSESVKGQIIMKRSKPLKYVPTWTEAKLLENHESSSKLPSISTVATGSLSSKEWYEWASRFYDCGGDVSIYVVGSHLWDMIIVPWMTSCAGNEACLCPLLDSSSSSEGRTSPSWGAAGAALTLMAARVNYQCV